MAIDISTSLHSSHEYSSWKQHDKYKSDGMHLGGGSEGPPLTSFVEAMIP